MSWKAIEKIKGFLEVPYDFFRLFVYVCTAGFVYIVYQDGLSAFRMAAPVIILLYALFFFFKAAGKKISREASDEYYYAKYRKALPSSIERDLFHVLVSPASLPNIIGISKSGIDVGYRKFLLKDYLYEDLSDETDMAGVANWLAEAIYSRYKIEYEVKMTYFRSAEFQENSITGFRLEMKREAPKLQKW